MYSCRLILSVSVSVCFPDCPDLTAGSLEPLTRCPIKLHTLTLSGGVPDTVSLEPLTRCPGLERLTLSGGVPDTVSLEPLTRCPGLQYLTLSGGVPDAVLDSLSGCPGLKVLTLGDLQRPAETAFTAAAVTRLVKSCRKLRYLHLHCTADTTRAVLTALKEADLGRRSYGLPRTIYLHVPGELYRQLRSQGSDQRSDTNYGLDEPPSGLPTDRSPSDIVWFKDGRRLPAAASRPALQLTGGNRSVAGMYQCHVTDTSPPP
ncbi:uncharacterized protein LOC122383333, partial [Amphibalanus amphitrite]|uniref:uncharacterized protein LOC122383333 n=1 Tax=Amphibalanus amphitrite TaxID=1232801 RepID=UPI001C8FB316